MSPKLKASAQRADALKMRERLTEKVAENRGKLAKKSCMVSSSYADTQLLSDRGDTCSTSAGWSYRRPELEEKEDLLNQLISNRGVCRTAPATQGLLIKHKAEYDGKVMPRPFFVLFMYHIINLVIT